MRRRAISSTFPAPISGWIGERALHELSGNFAAGAPHSSRTPQEIHPHRGQVRLRPCGAFSASVSRRCKARRRAGAPRDSA